MVKSPEEVQESKGGFFRREQQFTPEQTRGYAARVVAETQKAQAVEVAGIEAATAVATEGIGILKELIRASVSNPLLGPVAAVIVSDMLQRAKIIGPGAAGIVQSFSAWSMGVGLGVSAATTAANIIDQLNPFDMFKAPPPNPPDLIRPSAQVVVFGDAAGEKVAKALAPQIVPAARYIEGLGE